MRVYTFTKADRLLKRSEFLTLSQDGQKIQNRQFILVFLPNRFSRSRLGITVTRKVGNAVVRNRIRRVIREYFRTRRSTLKGSWDLNVIAKTRSADLSTLQVFDSVGNLFQALTQNARND